MDEYFFISVYFLYFNPSPAKQVNTVGKTVFILVDNTADASLYDQLGAFQARGCGHVKGRTAAVIA